MRILRTIMLLLAAFIHYYTALGAPLKKIQVTLRIGAGSNREALEINYTSDPIARREIPGFTPLLTPESAGKNSWTITAEKPVQIQIVYKVKNRYVIMLEPGSDITVQLLSNGVEVKGKGSEMFNMQYKDIYPYFAQLKEPSTTELAIPKSLSEFYEWSDYLDQKAAIVNRAVDKYEALYPSDIWNYERASLLASIENERCSKFDILNTVKKQIGVSPTEIKKIYDTQIFNKNLKWLLQFGKETTAPMERYLRFVHAALIRKYAGNEHAHADIFNDDIKRYAQYIRIIDSITTGGLKDQLTTYFILTRVGRKGSFEAANQLLPAALDQIASAGYKDYLKKELGVYAKDYATGGDLSDFLLLDINGKEVSRKDMRFKTLVLHVKNSENPRPDPLFEAAVREFSGNSSIVLAEISYGKKFEVWKQETANSTPADKNILSLYAPSTGDYRDFIEIVYKSINRPTLVYYQYKNSKHSDVFQKSVLKDALRITGPDTVAAVLEVIRREVTKYDGPYVRYAADTSFVYQVSESESKKDTIYGNPHTTFDVYSLPGIPPFSLKINAPAEPPAHRYDMPGKLLVLSDLEGNFSAFRRLLMQQRVIDSSYNWTFGKGHVVIAGDVFDRGKQVTACLWLMYALENKAKEAGGAFHFILGNHEVMNLTPVENNYVYPTYFRFAASFGLSYKDLFKKNTVLGQWLRTRNIAEIIGDNLIVHAGISSRVNDLKLPIDKLNELHRNYLLGNRLAPTDTAVLKILVNTKVSPYWYRGYYTKSAASSSESDVINRTLEIYNVKRIITGHTIAEDVAGYFDGKVINVDTKHAKDDNEGLLIENNIPYRITLDGIRERLK